MFARVKRPFLVYFLFGLTLSPSLCLAQAPHWGASVQGVRMTVSMTNATVKMGSNATITLCITNSSTNFVAIGDTGGALYDNNVVVTDSAGNDHDFTPREAIRAFIHNTFLYIKPAAGHSEQLDLHFGSEFRPGEYTCRVKRPIVFGKTGKVDKDNRRDLISNVIKVKVE
jgi:hypothetical protein